MSVLNRRLDALMHRFWDQTRKSGNPWFSIPLDLQALDPVILAGFTPDAMTLVQMASTDQICLVRFLYSASCRFTAPITEEQVRETLREAAYDLKVDSRHRFKLPWDLAKPLLEQIAEVEAFLPTVDRFWFTEMCQAGVTYMHERRLALAPIFGVLANFG